jgi:ribokinase
MRSSVVVIGSFVQDLTWSCPEFPRAGETVIGSFATGPGGKGSNQAIACGRAGIATTFIGAVGNDAFGAAAKQFYRRERIGARLVVKRQAPTGTAAILVNGQAQNEIVVALGASAQLEPREVDAAMIRAAEVVVCQHEANLRVNAHAFRIGRRAGTTTVLNPAPMRADFDPTILKSTDILIPNETELVALAKLHARTRHFSPADLASAELHRLCRGFGVATVIVTLGARGCLVSEALGFTAIRGHTNLRIVDTTGAGDAFVGGFAAGLVRFGGDRTAAARYGNAVAALSVTRPGTAPAMPMKGEIDRFLRERRIAVS